MLSSIPLQIPTRPKKAAGDISARFGRSAGFRQQGSIDQSDVRPFHICRLRKEGASSPDMRRKITMGWLACLTGWDRRFSFLGQGARRCALAYPAAALGAALARRGPCFPARQSVTLQPNRFLNQRENALSAENPSNSETEASGRSRFSI